MSKEELEKLKQIIVYFGHWYDVIGEERILILEKSIEYIANLEKRNTELKELIEKYRQAVDKCLHITFMGVGCEVNTIGQYATLVDGYLTDVEGLAKWKN